MTSSDYPLLAIPGHELYQLAHIATFVADGLGRHRRAVSRRDRDGRRGAARDVLAGRTALAAATGSPDAVSGPLPHPLDAESYKAAEGLLAGDGKRSAQVVSLASLGRQSWAVIGFVPGIGRVGAEVADHDLAGALREHLLTRPQQELAPWAITRYPLRLGQDRWGTADDEAAVTALDPSNAQHQAVARHLRGINDPLDAAVAQRFQGIDLDALQPNQQPTGTAAAPPATAGREDPAEQRTSSSAAAVATAAAALTPEGVDASAGEGEPAAGLAGLLSPPTRTERRTEMAGGTGGVMSGCPTRSTSAQRRARTSSVRAPVSSDSTM